MTLNIKNIEKLKNAIITSSSPKSEAWVVVDIKVTDSMYDIVCNPVPKHIANMENVAISLQRQECWSGAYKVECIKTYYGGTKVQSLITTNTSSMKTMADFIRHIIRNFID